MKTFETRALSLGQGFIWVLFVGPLVWILYEWYLYFSDRVGAFISDPTIPLAMFTLIIAAGFTLFGLAAFPRIEIDKDSVVVKYAFVRQLFAQEEVRIDSKGHILRLGSWTTGGWYIPFKEEECNNLLNRQVGKYRSKPLFILFLLPMLTLGFYSALIRSLGGTLDPLLWAILWGAVVAISLTIFAYGVPGEIRISSLDRGASSMVFGLSIGIIVFFLMFFV